jgi:hypothetical protein
MTTDTSKTRRSGRRGNGECSITFTGDRWQARLTMENGKRKAFLWQDPPRSAAEIDVGATRQEQGTAHWHGRATGSGIIP